MTDTLIKVEGVSKRFCRSLKRSLWYGMQDLGRELAGRRHGGDGELREDEFWAIHDVSFELERGSCMGLIGRNGAGKTTLLRMLNGLIKPDRGRIEMRGRVGALIALNAGFNPILSGRENIYVNASVLGLTEAEVEKKIDSIIEFSGVGDFIDSPVQSYSSGMQVRLGFAVATALKPDILLVDEVLAVGDLAFRAKSYQRIGEIMSDTAIIIVSHNEAQLYRLCDSVMWLSGGRSARFGAANHVLDEYIADSAMASAASRVLSKDIAKFEVESYTIDSLSNTIIINFDIVSKKYITLSSFTLHFSKGGEFVCHASADIKGGRASRLLAGANRFCARVDGMPLTSGVYSISVIVYEDNDRALVMQVNDFLRVRFEGAPPSSSNVNIPMILARDE